jgi:formate hydrogenlyase transcriptional activator
MSTPAIWASDVPAVTQNESFGEDAALVNSDLDTNEFRGKGIPRIVGNSAALRSVLGMVRIVAPTDATVLINGETGTGKELIAEAVHRCSNRSNGPFVKVNCAAIPAGLLESELFGHERGAFTGAVARSIGRFERANHGTLFLDEIGDLPLEMQPKILRVLQERQFERLGSAATIHTDVRVICATHQNLVEMIDQRQFRADLFYRLSVFPIELPPLRERREDIPLLVRDIVRNFANQQGKAIETIPSDVMAALESHDWPGNIRELQNVIERGVIMTSGPVLSRQTMEHWTYGKIAPARVPEVGEPVSVKTLADAERAHITATLDEANWVVGGTNGAGAQLGLPRTTLLARMQRLGISSGVARRRSGQSTEGSMRTIGDMSSRMENDPAASSRVLVAAAG